MTEKKNATAIVFVAMILAMKKVQKNFVFAIKKKESINGFMII